MSLLTAAHQRCACSRPEAALLNFDPSPAFVAPVTPVRLFVGLTGPTWRRIAPASHHEDSRTMRPCSL